MEYIGMKRIMDRLTDNPNMKSLKLSSAAAYVKDFSSINEVHPILSIKYGYIKIEDSSAMLPEEVLDLRAVYMCNCTDLSPLYHTNNRLAAGLDASLVRDVDKEALGRYHVQNGVLFSDIKDTVLEIKYKALNLDNMGFPLLPYDGSLMQAIENYVKYRYYCILYEIGEISERLLVKANQEYCWYIGQYTSKQEMLSYDEALSIANSWQRLIDTKNLDTRGREFPELKNM